MPETIETITLQEVPRQKTLLSLESLLSDIMNICPPKDRLRAGDHFLFWNDHASQAECHMEVSLQKDGYHGLQAPNDELWQHRLWKSGSIEFLGVIHLDQPARCRESISNIESSAGANATIEVQIKREIIQDSMTKLIEMRTLLYTTQDHFQETPQASTQITKGELLAEIPTSSRLLFAYSALTCNAHRIHYDREYAQHTEHYPDLLVQGSLSATIALKLLDRLPGEIKSCTYKLISPAFVNETLQFWALTRELGSGRTQVVVRAVSKASQKTKMVMKAAIGTLHDATRTMSS